ncbi:hypothetical protein [[Micrococcus luteus] ATCC 49442]|uniref:hypothetical protein n=1 Tax=[Micrococcus luteus] ATCC 49442 TaxID=2698727 RepID=UPI0013D9BAA8|nr:hypothetical protein [[Micrococcus luteus] ATCC 49442]
MRRNCLTPIFLWVVPPAVIAVVVLFFVKEKPLATTVEHDMQAEAISEGNILITDNAAVTPHGDPDWMLNPPRRDKT